VFAFVADEHVPVPVVNALRSNGEREAAEIGVEGTHEVRFLSAPTPHPE
jgi:hypothetical protein